MAQPPHVLPAEPAKGSSDTSFFGHPRGLSTLFFTEMWERFSYYGMRALLILFMTASPAQGGLGFDVAKAGAIYGLYTGLIYAVSLPGGWIADKVLGMQGAIFWGGVIIAFGHLCLALPNTSTFYLGLGLIIIGTGLLKPNASALVGELYSADDQRRDAGFSIYYMGVNLGAFIAPLICGYLGQTINWHYGFGAAGLGMVAGLIQYRFGRRHLGQAGLRPSGIQSAADAQAARATLTRWVAGFVALAGLLAVVNVTGFLTITAQGVSDVFGLILIALVFVAFGGLFLAKGWSATEHRRLWAILALFAASCLFWSVFEQAGSTLNLFAERNSENTVLGYSFPASWYQSENSLFLITLAPVFAWLWVRLGSKEPSTPAKFSWGLVFVGLGFLVLVPAATLAAAGAKVSPLWLTLTYLFHTIGELCLSPVGLSAMTKLAPARVAGMMMGLWFLSLSVGNYLGGRLSTLYESLPLPTLFGAVGAFASAVGLVLFLFSRPIRRLMGGVH